MLSISLLSILLTVGLTGYWFAQEVREQGDKARKQTSQLLQIATDLHEAQFTLSAQMQEWKDMLLRMHDPALFLKHQQGFAQQQQAVIAALQNAQDHLLEAGLDVTQLKEFQRQHGELLANYSRAMQRLDRRHPLSYRAADHLVIDMDRQLREGIARFSREVEAMALQRTMQIDTLDINPSVLLALGALGVGLPMLSGLLFFAVYRGLRQIGRSDARIRAIHESIGDGVVVCDTQGRIESLNDAAQHMTGWTAAQARGQAVNEVMRIYDASGTTRVECPLEEVLCTGVRVPVSNGMLRSRDGREFAIENCATPVRDEHGAMIAVVMVFHDVSERYAMLRRVRQERALFRQTFDLASVGMAHLGMDGKWTRVNRALCEITGYSEDELLALSFQGITHPDDVGKDLAELQKLQTRQIDHYCTEKRYLRKDWRIVWVNLNVSIVWNEDGTPAYGISIIEDIQARKEAEARAALEHRRTAVIARLGEVVGQSGQLEAIYDGAMDALQQGMDCERASILLFDPDGVIRFKAWRGLSAAYIERFTGHSPWTPEEKNAQPILVADEETWEDGKKLVPEFRKAGIRALAFIPLEYAGQLLGKFMVYFNAPHEFDDGEVQFMQTVARHVGYAIGQKRAELEIEHLAYHDQLTGLANRRLLIDRLGQAINSGLRRDSMVAVLLLDLDHFKDVNDQFGHASGDALLQVLAGRLQGCVRAEDTVARLGGDEFVVMLSEVADSNAVAEVAQKILQVVQQPILLEQVDLHSSTSIGIGLFPQDGNDADTLIQHADAALYLAKQQGRSTYRFFTEALHRQTMQRLETERLLRMAVERNEFELYYQPKILLASGEIVGCEALIRWNQPERGLVMPDAFIPIAEHSQLIFQIGAWVMREACRQAALWQGQGRRLGVAFNVSPRQFMHPEAFLENLRGALQESGVDPALMEIEMTESLLLDDTGMGDVLQRIRTLGIHLTLDDFGTGYSSLSYLRRFPISTLKIDRSFVNDSDRNRNDAEMVKTIVGMAHNLRMNVVAEGIETASQNKLLIGLKCEMGQGYLFSHPLPLAAFEALLTRNEAALTKRRE